MHARFTGMTLQTLLQQHGITTIKELMHRTGLSRQHCWGLWHGYDGVGKATAKSMVINLVIVSVILFFFAWGVVGLIVDQWPCFIGVPNCD